MIEPHPYPSAWYHVASSAELKPGAVRSVQVCDARVAVFRNDITGEAAALDSQCAHLGADLGLGRVRDGCLRCPFHGWMYDERGRVRKIPYAERVPQRLGVRAWPVVEIDRQVFVWYSAPGARLEPTYALRSKLDHDFVHRGSYDGGQVQMRLFDFAENGPDLRHFPVVHRQLHMPWTSIPMPGWTMQARPSWRRDPTHWHIAWLDMWATACLFGRPIESMGAQARVEFIGPGSVAVFHFVHDRLGRIVLYQTHTPTAERSLRARFAWFSERRVPRAVVWYVIGHWISQWRDDVRIWQSKRHRTKPQLIAEDGPIIEMRHWFEQFYSSHPQTSEVLHG